jgi:hypothetical protein
MERKKHKNFKVMEMDKYILYQTEYNEKKKSIALSVILGILFGILGLLYTSGSTFFVMLVCYLGYIIASLALLGPVQFMIVLPFATILFYIVSIYLCYSTANHHNKELIETLKKKYLGIEQEESTESKQGIDPTTTQEKQKTDPTIIFCIFLVVAALLWFCGLF